jgi:DNA-binding helix-hairpin-helix protein with protein kinase domain
MSFQPQKGVIIYGADNRPLVLDQEIGKGGEGSVWAVTSDANVVAKFYHKGLEVNTARKIEAMCRLKSDALLKISAWPLATLKTKSGAPEGLLMPRISGHQEAHLLYTPKSRRTNFPEAQFSFIVHVSMNIARAFATVHDAGQVIGDVNHGNLLVARDGRVRLIDCDSFEINDGSTIFPCSVGVPLYTPPELQGRSFQGVRRTKQHDAFGLAVLIFHLLFLGRHPFAGIFRGGREDKTIEDAIREYRFAYQPDNRLSEMEPPAIPHLSEFPPELGRMFLQAFGRGRRPAAQEWLPVLESLARNLKQCPSNDTHHYYRALGSCPWCRVENASGKTMFGAGLRSLVVRDLISTPSGYRSSRFIQLGRVSYHPPPTPTSADVSQTPSFPAF